MASQWAYGSRPASGAGTRPGLARPEGVGLGQRQTRRHVPVQRIVGGRLVRDDVGHDTLRRNNLRKHFGAVANQADG